jgi:rhamnosyltransferase subunit B
VSRLVLATMGSWGDLFPVIGLAKAAAARGHDVRVVTTSAYAALLEAEGLALAAAGPRFGPEEFAADPAILSGRRGGYAGFLHLFQTVVFPNLMSWVDDLRRALADADLLISHPTVLAAPIAAELTGTPWVTFSVFPGLVPSEWTLPGPSRLRLPSGRTGRAICRAAWRGARWNIRRSFDRPVNIARERHGLAPVRDALFLPVQSGNPYLVGASPTVVDRPPDWPSNIHLTGFFAWDTPRSYPVPDGLSQFMDSGGPPVLITLGGSSAVDPKQFYPDAVAAVRGLGHRALVLTGPTPEPVRLESGPDAHVVRFAPLSQVAPACCAAVHHGGIGTTVAVLAAGLPQLIVPRGFDQPQTALRMRRLGVAETVPWTRASSGRLARGLTRLLTTDAYRERAVAIAAALAGERGLKTALDAVEQLLGRRPDALSPD